MHLKGPSQVRLTSDKWRLHPTIRDPVFYQGVEAEVLEDAGVAVKIRTPQGEGWCPGGFVEVVKKLAPVQSSLPK